MEFDRLGPYRIDRKLGEGGMGAVYLGTHQDDSSRVAIKLLPSALAKQPGFRIRFESEIETLRKLEHPNIIRLIGFGEDQGQVFFSMEFVEGKSLQDELDDGRRFDWREVVTLGLQLCKALKHAHDRGIIHRDIKPANIMLAAGGVAKLADFGIARLYGASGMTMSGGPIGTATYMAPEQIDGGTVNERSDLYALGGTFYALLTGRPPFVADTLMAMLNLQKSVDPEPVTRYAPRVPRELEVVIATMLKKVPGNRIANAMALSRALQATVDAVNLREGNAPAAPAPPPASAGSGVKRSVSAPVGGDATLPGGGAVPATRDADRTLTSGGDTGGGQDQTLASGSVTDPDATAAGVAPGVAPGGGPGGAGSANDVTLASSDGPDLDSTAPSAMDPDRTADSVRKPGATTRPSSVKRVREAEVDDDDEGLPDTIFITAEEAAEADRLRAQEEEAARPRVIPTTSILLVVFMVVVIPVVVWLFRPPSADKLHEQIVQLKERADDGDSASVAAAIDLIRTFEFRFPADARLDDLLSTREDLEMHGFSPIQSAYRQALGYQRANDPIRALVTLNALIDLYGDPSLTLRRVEELHVERARRLRDRLQRTLDRVAESETPMIRDRLDAARRSAPPKARVICEAIIALYGDKPWAASLVEEAREIQRSAAP